MQKTLLGLVCATMWFGATAALAKTEEAPPAYKQYCACKELFGRTTLNLMSYNPVTKQEQKIRPIAEIKGSAVFPAMQNCGDAIKKKTYPECTPIEVLAPAPLAP